MRILKPVEIELDRKRSIVLNYAALFKAEREINRQRGAPANDFVSIDYLVLTAARKGVTGAGGFPLDLIAVLLWAGLLHEDPKLTVDLMLDFMGRSPLTRGEIVNRIWEAYERSTGTAENSEANGEDKDRRS